jgi:hypothetical protein
MIKIISLLIFSVQILFGLPTLTTLNVVENQGEVTTDSIIYLNIPERDENAITGTEFVNQVINLSLTDREKRVAKEILSGNVPSFSRKLRPLKINQTINGENYEIIFFTVCDYMAIGSDTDYLYIPMTPSTAQYLADNMNCLLPTKKIVDVIYAQAETKLKPQPIPPSDKMTTIPVFKQHTDSIKQQITQIGLNRSGNNIIAGHKKDIIISNKIYSNDRNYERVVIYGWHLSVNNPIQPVYNGHIAEYADYSHGVRLIFKTAVVNGDSVQVEDILKDSNLSKLLSSEGVIAKPYYPQSKIFTSMINQIEKKTVDFILRQNYPNPFNPCTTIAYSIPSLETLHATSQRIQLKVYDVLGKEVATLVNEKKPSGNYEVTFNGNKLMSGVYFYKLQSDGFVKTKKLILLK